MFSLSFIRVFLPVDEHHLPLLEGSTSEFWVGRAPTAPLRQQLRAAATQNQAPASPPKMQPPKKNTQQVPAAAQSLHPLWIYQGVLSEWI